MKKKIFACIIIFICYIVAHFTIGYNKKDIEVIEQNPPQEEVVKSNHQSTNTTSQNLEKKDFTHLYKTLKPLSGQDALTFFENLPASGLTDAEILDFFINIPLSDANPEIVELYKREEFDKFMSTYPSGAPYNGYKWTKGNGTPFKGDFSSLDLKLPFSDYVSIENGPVGNPNQTYRIGVAIHGFDQPWCVSLADAAQWEADRHPNIEIDVRDGQWDNDQMADIIDSFILQKVHGILTWPMVEAETTIAPVQRAIEAGIPVVSVDRMTGLEETTSRITGNFPANGAQSGMYLVWKLASEGELKANVVLLRKPLGSTADANRTGHFLRVLSYFPGIKIVKSLHDKDSTAEAYANAQVALNELPEIDVFFGTGDHETIAAYDASESANRLHSRKDGKKIIFLSIDDSKTAITRVRSGQFELNTPYTPLISDIGMRTLINLVTKDQSMPHDIITPNIPMVTQNGDVIFGFQTQTPDQWYEYTFGPPIDQ